MLLQFTYDALGRRVQTTEHVDPQSGAVWDGLSGHPSPRITRHIYAGLEPIQEYTCGGPGAPACDGSYTLAREFVWGDTARFPEPIAMVDYTGANSVSGCDTGTPPVGCAYHYLRDALGSVTGLTDATGHLVERYTYDPYGKVLIERYDATANGGVGAWIATNASSFGNPLTWTGHRYDAAVGLYHTLFRHYSPQLGRWLQRDPIGYRGGLNLYGYCLGNPIYWYDPYGLGFWSTVGDIVSGIGTGIYNVGAGALSAIAHPIDTSSALGEAAALQFYQFTDAGHSENSALVGTGMVLIAQSIGTEGLVDAYEGKDHEGTELSTEERISHGTTGAIQAGMTGTLVRSGLGPAKPKAKPPAPRSGTGGGSGSGPAGGGGTTGTGKTGGTKPGTGEVGPPNPPLRSKCPQSRPGSVSGNPANRLVETGVPKKDGSGWVQRWTKMTAEEEAAYGKALADRHTQLVIESSKLPPEQQASYIFEGMRQFRTEYRQGFLKNR